MIQPRIVQGPRQGLGTDHGVEARTIGSASRALRRRAIGADAWKRRIEAHVLTKYGTEACEKARPGPATLKMQYHRRRVAMP